MKNLDIKRLKQINPDIVHENGEVDSFKSQMIDLLTGKYNFRNAMIIAPSSDVLEYVDGVKSEKPLVMLPNKVLKIMNEHGLEREDLSKLSELLDGSVFAFDSLTQESSRVIILPRRDFMDDVVVAVCRTDAEDRVLEVNQITSIYGKEKFQRFLDKTYTQGKNFYCNSHTKERIEELGLELPEELKLAFDAAAYNGVVNQESTSMKIEQDFLFKVNRNIEEMEKQLNEKPENRAAITKEKDDGIEI